MSIDRFDLVKESFEKKAVPAECPEGKPSEYFGELVFDRKKMARYLDNDTLSALLDCIDNGKPLDRATADKVAELSERTGIHVHYSLKANSDRRLNEMISSRGIGADCVSGDEIDFAVSCGYDPKKIFFAGVAKSDKEICQAFQVGIGAFVVESLEEIEIVSDIARRLGRKAPMSLRINPNIDPHTHHYITTGLYEDKFGISDRSFDEAVAMVKYNPYIDFYRFPDHGGGRCRQTRMREGEQDRRPL